MCVNCLVWQVGLPLNISVSIRQRKGFGPRVIVVHFVLSLGCGRAIDKLGQIRPEKHGKNCMGCYANFCWRTTLFRKNRELGQEVRQRIEMLFVGLAGK
jgi:hypothetical protein